MLCTSPSPTMASAVPSTLPLRGGTKQRKLASPDQAKQRKNRNTRKPTRCAQDRGTPALVRLTACPREPGGGTEVTLGLRRETRRGDPRYPRNAAWQGHSTGRQGWGPKTNSEDGPNPVASLLEHTPLPSATMTTQNQERALHEIWRLGSFALS